MMSLLLKAALNRNVCFNAIQNKGPLTAIFRGKHIINSTNKMFLINKSLPIQRCSNGKLVVRKLSSNAHDHSKLWVLEKAVSIGLLAVIPAAFLYPSQMLDHALALSLVAHVHWGFEAIVVDYIRPSLFGSVIPKIAVASLYLVSFVALAGLFYLNYSDVGLSSAVRMISKA